MATQRPRDLSEDRPQLYDPKHPPFAIKADPDDRKRDSSAVQFRRMVSGARHIDAGCAALLSLFLVQRVLWDTLGPGWYWKQALVGAAAVGLLVFSLGNGQVANALANWLTDYPQDED